MRRIAALLVALAACADLKSAPSAGSPSSDAGTSPDTNDGSTGDSDATGLTDAGADAALLPPDEDAGVGPAEPCQPKIECLDAAEPHVIEVPTEKTIGGAILVAKPGDTIQVRGQVVSESFALPSGVHLRGCENAGFSGTTSFGAGSGSIEGFDVTGSINVNVSGHFSVARCRFRRGLSAQDPGAGISVTSISGSTGIQADVTVGQSLFTKRDRGIDLLATSNTAGSGLSVTVENTIFARVEAPIVVTSTAEGATTALAVSASTFYDFSTAIQINAPSKSVRVGTSLFVLGLYALDGPGTVAYSFTNAVQSPGAGFLSVDPMFVDVTNDDFRLSRGSPAVNRVSGILVVPPKDFQGCPRPAGIGTDPGAFESQ